jgi:DNA polymerase III epsilon subunit-like protein
MSHNVNDSAPTPVFYDFEASGLNGFPIEIGWAYVEPKAISIIAEGHLIRPALDWSAEDAWDENAEQLHGISVDQLWKRGEPADKIAARMNEQLGGRSLYADSPFDEQWLSQLFEATPLSPSFIVRRTAPDILARQFAAHHRLPATTVDRAIAFARIHRPQRHRAAEDAAHWAAVWLFLIRQPSE